MTARPIVVCPLAALGVGEVATVHAEGVGDIAVFNAEGELFALADRCTHERARLSDGFLEGRAVECPLHASLFDLATGEPSGPPATVPVATYPVWVDGGDVVVEVEGP